MSPETSKDEPKKATERSGQAEAAKDNSKAETGPLRLSDIKDLSPDQKNEAAQKAIRAFNAAFEGMDPNTVRAAIRKAGSEITLSDLNAIDELEAKVMPFLARKKSKTNATSDLEGSAATEPELEAETELSGIEETKPATPNVLAQNSGKTEEPEVVESTETQLARHARLAAFVLEYFPDCPAEFVDHAAGICLQYEDDYRSVLEEPDLKLSADDAQDPEISDTINSEIFKAQAETAKSNEIKTNQSEIKNKEGAVTEKQTTEAQQDAEIMRNQPKVDAAERDLPKLNSELKDSKAAIKDQKTENARDRKELKNVSAEERAALKAEDAEEAKNDTVTEDLKTVKELQSRFNSLKAEKGTIGALKTLLGPEGVKSPSMKAVVKRVLGTAQSLVAAIPGKSAVVERYLNQLSVDFSASAPAQTFAGFLALVDSSDEFTEEERTQIRQILNSSSPAPASSAAELKDALKQGRGTKQITGIQRVEEPPGSGNFVEKEVVVGTETIPFTKSEPYVLSNNPLVKLHPVSEGSSTYQVNAAVTNASPINFTVDIPQDKPIPEQAINNQVNQHLLRATLQNANLRGVMDFWYGQGDSTFGAGGETSGASLGGGDMSKAITNMFLGQNTLQGNRFLTRSELGRIAHDARWLVPGGDFGGTNKVAGAESNQMMKALFGEDKTEITDNMARAHFVINSGGAEDPGFEGLYQSMYPEDTDFARLTDIVGSQAVAALNLNRPEEFQKAA